MVDAGRSVEVAAAVAAATAVAVAGRVGDVRRPVSVGVAMRSADAGAVEKKKKKAGGGGEARRVSVGVAVRSTDEVVVEKKKTAAAPDAGGSSGGGGEDHPYDFLVCGPRNVSFPNWRDLFRSSW